MSIKILSTLEGSTPVGGSELVISGTSFLRAGSNDLGSIQLGSGAITTGVNDAIAIGNNANACASFSIGIGQGAHANGDGIVAIGNNAAGGTTSSFGANAVVTKDLPDNAVAVGIPAQIVSYEGSKDFVIFDD